MERRSLRPTGRATLRIAALAGTAWLGFALATPPADPASAAGGLVLEPSAPRTASPAPTATRRAPVASHVAARPAAPRPDVPSARVTLELVDDRGRLLAGTFRVTSGGETHALRGPRATLELALAEEVHVRAAAWGHQALETRRRPAGPADVWTLALAPRPGIHGHVVAATPRGGGAVRDLTITLEPADGDPRAPRHTPPRTRTDERGGFFLVAEPGTYRLVAHLAGGVAIRGPLVRLAPEASLVTPWLLPFVLEDVGLVAEGRRAPPTVTHLGLEHPAAVGPIHLVHERGDDAARAWLLHRAAPGTAVVVTGNGAAGERLRITHQLRAAHGFRGAIEGP